MKIRDIMTTSVESVSPDTDLVMIARRMKELNVGSLPVVEGNRLIGIITDRDIVLRAVAEGKQVQNEHARNYLTPNPTTISSDRSIQDASAIMAREQIRRLPVVDADRLVGFVSIGDIAVEAGKDQVVGDTLEKISEPAGLRQQEVADR